MADHRFLLQMQTCTNHHEPCFHISFNLFFLGGRGDSRNQSLCGFFFGLQALNWIDLSLVSQQGSAFAVLADDVAVTNINTGGLRECNDDGSNEEDSHDGEGEDPLQGHDDGQELGDAES